MLQYFINSNLLGIVCYLILALSYRIISRVDLAFRTVSLFSLDSNREKRKDNSFRLCFLLYGYREMSGISIFEYGFDSISARKIYIIFSRMNARKEYYISGRFDFSRMNARKEYYIYYLCCGDVLERLDFII